MAKYEIKNGGERIGVRFRLAGSQIVITAYYDDEEEKIVENCELLFPYSAVNYRATAACIKTVEHELGLKYICIGNRERL